MATIDLIYIRTRQSKDEPNNKARLMSLPDLY